MDEDDGKFPTNQQDRTPRKSSNQLKSIRQTNEPETFNQEVDKLTTENLRTRNANIGNKQFTSKRQNDNKSHAITDTDDSVTTENNNDENKNQLKNESAKLKVQRAEQQKFLDEISIKEDEIRKLKQELKTLKEHNNVLQGQLASSKFFLNIKSGNRSNIYIYTYIYVYILYFTSFILLLFFLTRYII